jgi:hypothetical protein
LLALWLEHGRDPRRRDRLDTLVRLQGWPRVNRLQARLDTRLDSRLGADIGASLDDRFGTRSRSHNALALDARLLYRRLHLRQRPRLCRRYGNGFRRLGPSLDRGFRTRRQCDIFAWIDLLGLRNDGRCRYRLQLLPLEWLFDALLFRHRFARRGSLRRFGRRKFVLELDCDYIGPRLRCAHAGKECDRRCVHDDRHGEREHHGVAIATRSQRVVQLKAVSGDGRHLVLIGRARNVAGPIGLSLEDVRGQ